MPGFQSPVLTFASGSLPLEEFTSQLSKARAAAASAGDAKSPAQKHRQQQKQKQDQQIAAITGDMQEEPARPVIRPLYPGVSLAFGIPRARKQQFFVSLTFVILSSMIVRAGGPLPPKPFEEMDDEEFIEWKISTGYKTLFLVSLPL